MHAQSCNTIVTFEHVINLLPIYCYFTMIRMRAYVQKYFKLINEKNIGIITVLKLTQLNYTVYIILLRVSCLKP